jgi:diaminohydroxyphosphoribosylaminopyrimidine deaminase/5-amino-6-(5-phosphoribosylamino)uracil reductase
MARALRLAERGLFTTQPNPRVGCVIAHGETVIGEGWHQRAGEPHAEVFALRAAGQNARGATAYVTLEPCSHTGRTPPCADALIAAGVARVVTAGEDPNPNVAGAGLRALRRAGIAVEAGLLRDAARELNRGFFSRIERGRPWVRVKLAMSLDGRTALSNGESKWISSDAARTDVQQWRARSSAIMTGIGTVLTDNPRLTVRLDQHHPHPTLPGSAIPASPSNTALRILLRAFSGVRAMARARAASPLEGEAVKPVRVVLDRELRTPRGALVLDGSVPTLIVHGDGSRVQDDRFAGIELSSMPLRDKRLDLAAVLSFLAGRGVNELQVEAGPTLCGALFAADLVDELLLYIAPVVLGDQALPLLRLPGIDTIAAGRRLRVIDQRAVGTDQRLLLRG